MSAEINPEGLTEELEGGLKELSYEAMGRWFTASQKRLQGAGSARSGIDAEPVPEGRENTDLWKIAQTALPPQWDGDKWVFTYNHPAAVYHEFGTEPHEIEASDGGVLAFEWPDAPDEVIAMFTPGGDEEVNRGEWDGWVYFPKIQHPGNPAIGYVRYGRAAAESFLKGEGVETREL